MQARRAATAVTSSSAIATLPAVPATGPIPLACVDPSLSLASLSRRGQNQHVTKGRRALAAARYRLCETLAEKIHMLDSIRRARICHPARTYAYRCFMRETGKTVVTIDLLRAFLGDRVLLHGYSSKPLHSLLCNLKAVAVEQRAWEVSDEDYTSIHKEATLWQKEEPGEAVTRTPFCLTDEIMQAFTAIADSGFLGLMLVALACLLHDAMFRSGDVLDGAMARAHVQTHKMEIDGRTVETYEFHTYMSKTNKTSAEAQRGFVLNDYSINMLRRYLAAYDKLVPAGTDLSDAPLFPKVDRDGTVRDFTAAWSKLSFIKLLNKELGAKGVKSGPFKGHDFRHGGKTSFLNLGVPEALVDKLGRWTSKASAIYDNRTGIALSRACRLAMIGILEEEAEEEA